VAWLERPGGGYPGGWRGGDGRATVDLDGKEHGRGGDGQAALDLADEEHDRGSMEASYASSTALNTIEPLRRAVRAVSAAACVAEGRARVVGEGLMRLSPAAAEPEASPMVDGAGVAGLLPLNFVHISSHRESISLMEQHEREQGQRN
jgi:hypothetical protein